jgi:terminal uridylyltransferase
MLAWKFSETSNSLVDFFRHFAKDFLYNSGVASVRAGLLKKESKGWQHEVESNPIPCRKVEISKTILAFSK